MIECAQRKLYWAWDITGWDVCSGGKRTLNHSPSLVIWCRGEVMPEKGMQPVKAQGSTSGKKLGWLPFSRVQEGIRVFQKRWCAWVVFMNLCHDDRASVSCLIVYGLVPLNCIKTCAWLGCKFYFLPGWRVSDSRVYWPLSQNDCQGLRKVEILEGECWVRPEVLQGAFQVGSFWNEMVFWDDDELWEVPRFVFLRFYTI